MPCIYKYCSALPTQGCLCLAIDRGPSFLSRSQVLYSQFYFNNLNGLISFYPKDFLVHVIFQNPLRIESFIVAQRIDERENNPFIEDNPSNWEPQVIRSFGFMIKKVYTLGSRGINAFQKLKIVSLNLIKIQWEKLNF